MLTHTYSSTISLISLESSRNKREKKEGREVGMDRKLRETKGEETEESSIYVQITHYWTGLSCILGKKEKTSKSTIDVLHYHLRK